MSVLSCHFRFQRILAKRELDNRPAGLAFYFLPPAFYHQTLLHLAALCDCDICRRLALPSHSGIFDLVHNIHSVDNLAEDDMFVVQERRGNLRDAFSNSSRYKV